MTQSLQPLWVCGSASPSSTESHTFEEELSFIFNALRLAGRLLHSEVSSRLVDPRLVVKTSELLGCKGLEQAPETGPLFSCWFLLAKGLQKVYVLRILLHDVFPSEEQIARSKRK